MKQEILALDRDYQPHQWLTREDAIVHEATNEVIDHLGEAIFLFRGGHNRDGVQSTIATSSIIVLSGAPRSRVHRHPALTNSALFKRDRHLCAYCGKVFPHSQLTRDHVMPTSLGGPDVWMNVVTACRGCNSTKSNLRPGERLSHRRPGPQGNGQFHPLYVPYVPCKAEAMIMRNRDIKADQMEFLLARIKNKQSRVVEYARDLFGRDAFQAYT